MLDITLPRMYVHGLQYTGTISQLVLVTYTSVMEKIQA